jgi:hypothetical protein
MQDRYCSVVKYITIRYYRNGKYDTEAKTALVADAIIESTKNYHISSKIVSSIFLTSNTGKVYS